MEMHRVPCPGRSFSSTMSNAVFDLCLQTLLGMLTTPPKLFLDIGSPKKDEQPRGGSQDSAKVAFAFYISFPMPTNQK